MRCHNCGSENDKIAKFCAVCGQKLEPENEEVYQKPKKNREWILILVLLILAVVGVSGILIFQGQREKKQYQDHIAQGNRYMEEMDYEKAEAEYLKAIEIDAKQTEPYVQLADLYIVIEKPEKAREIIQQGIGKDMGETDKEILEDKQEEIKNLAEYTWVVEPSIEADDIYYLADYPDIQQSINELSRQADNPNAVIQRGNEFGIIGLNGELLADVAYKEIANFGDHYMMIKTIPEYSEEYGREWDIYWLDKDGEIHASVGNGSLEYTVYYYYDGTRQRAGWPQGSVQVPVPVQESSVYELQDMRLVMNSLSGKYALEYNGNLITDFIYDECGSLSEGLFAVCQDGKWGYVDEKGQIVIPIEYDASWDKYPVFDGGSRRSTSNVKEYCYAASDGYIVLCQNGEWELKDTAGNSAIKKGVFEAIRPVFDGKCWVKKNGKWGVIQLEKNTAESEDLDNNKTENISEEEAHDIFTVYSGNKVRELFFKYADYDNDGTSEAFGIATDDLKSNGIVSNVSIYYIGKDGKIIEVASQLHGFPMDTNTLKAGNNQFVVWEISAGGSGSISNIYGVRDGQVYEPQISGKYMRFWGSEEKGYSGETSDFSSGYHEYIEHQFMYDEELKEFIEI